MALTDQVKKTIAVLTRQIQGLEQENSNAQENIRQLQTGINEREKQNKDYQKAQEENRVWIHRAWETIKRQQERIKEIDTQTREIADHLNELVP